MAEKENKIKNVDQVFNFVKLKPFVESYTNLSVGLVYRNINTSSEEEESKLTQKQKVEIKQGLVDIIQDLTAVANSINIESEGN